jgi:ketosteroid isomerase-like protein
MNDSEKEILAVLEAYRATALAKDIPGHAARYDEKVRAFDLWADWSIDGRPAMRAMIQHWLASLASENVVIDAQEIRLEVEGPLATLEGFFTFEAFTLAATRRRDLSSRMSWVLRRRGAAWKIIHPHSSVPLGPGLKGILQR